MTNVNDVAAYITQHFDSPISTMKLQKLTYFSQGWALAVLGKPLFADDFEAWANGPVVYSLFDNHRGQFTVDAWKWGNASELNHSERRVIDAVLRNYGALSGAQLSEMTHRKGTPWFAARARAGAGPRQRAQEPVSKEDMKKFFGDEIGRARRSS